MSQSNHFFHLLEQWLPLKDSANWVLAAVINTRGSVYRKTGALMLLSDSGHQLGLLSGGCIESDLSLQARKVIALGKSARVHYDAQDEENIAWRLGIGCGGAAQILLHPCNRQNHYLQLEGVYRHLKRQQAVSFTLQLEEARASLTPCPRDFTQRQSGQIHQGALTCLINPLPHLLILGCGVDMLPLCNLALNLGWRVSLADERLSQAKRGHFPPNIQAVACSLDQLSDELLTQVDAVVIAHHSLHRDAEAVAALQQRYLPNPYVGLLGPAARKAQVLEQAHLTEAQLRYPVAGPMGLALGGELPESIALAVLAECHGRLFGSSALPLSHFAAAPSIASSVPAGGNR